MDAKTNGNSSTCPQMVRGEDGTVTLSGGTTKRELFAAMAMQGCLSNSMTVAEMSKYNKHDCKNTVDSMSRMAVAHADSLLAELAKEEG